MKELMMKKLQTSRHLLGLILASAVANAWAAEPMDHAAMGHGDMPMDHSAMTPASDAMQAMDHSQMNHDAMQIDVQPMPAMDHSKMDHGAMQMDSQPVPAMDHSQMNHDAMQMDVQPMPAMDHSKMDHGAMQMDSQPMPAMDHSKMDHAAPAPSAESRTPIPPITDADRAAAFPDVHGHKMHDNAINSLTLIDQLEYQNADEGSVLAWDASGWIGNDIDRLWWRSEGERTDGTTEGAEVQAFWGHAISPWWETVLGVRQDFKPGSPQTWAAAGIQGMALYNFETEATAYLGENGQSAARLEGEYDILLTNRLFLQPRAEANFYGKNDPGRGIGSGLADTELGLRLRYEIVRQFAPYIGVSWGKVYGNTADYVQEEGGDSSEARFVAGVRIWF
jgi:copper resistance protein B